MRVHSRGFTVAKWAGTILCLVLIAAGTYSARRWVIWDSPKLRCEIGLGLNAVYYAWRPEDWSIENERYSPSPGWTIANCSEDLSFLRWWVERSSNRSWESLTVSIWIPIVLLALPTGILWYRERNRTRQAIERLVASLRPRRRLRLSFWNIGGFLALQLLVVTPFCAGLYLLWEFLFPFPRHGISRAVADLIEKSLPVAFLGGPIWAILWAWLWVRWRNRLLVRRPGHTCIECGYDLTGNASGRCPECGEQIEHQVEPAK